MDAKQIQAIARDAIKNTRGHYGAKVWDFINRETRKAMVSRTIVVNFGTMAPDAPARDVAKAVSEADDMLDKGA